MKERIKNPKLIFEERKAIILFIWLFYLIYFSYEMYYHFISPLITKGREVGFSNEGLGIWVYILILGMLPVAIYFIKKDNPYIVKYIFICWYLSIIFVNDLVYYLGTNRPFAEGNIVEVLFVIFSPIFVNKKFFWTVTIGMVGKYILLGLILQDIRVVAPLIVFSILSAITFVILVRFFSYLKSLTFIYEELRQKEKLAVIGQMAAAIGHEIRNPLSSLKGFTQLQKERYPNTNEFYPIMIQEIDRINSIVNDLMYLGKPKVIEFEKANIEEIIAYTLSIIQQQAESQSVTVETVMEGPLPPMDCDGKQLKQVFLNLIKNAIEAMPNGGKIKINVNVIKGQSMYISIQDEGCGIADGNILNLGEPFYTTKKDGTGLGLMVSNQIINDHKGNINFQSHIGKGTKVEVVLPIMQK